MRSGWEALHASLARSIRTLKSNQAFAKAKAKHAALKRFADPGALVAFLVGSRDELDVKDDLLATLVTMVQRRKEAALATSLLWLGLWPGLDAIFRRRFRHFRGAPEELVSGLGAAFTEIVERLDLGRVHRVAATLVRSTERQLMDQCRRKWAEPVTVELDERLVSSGGDGSGLLDAQRLPLSDEDVELLAAVLLLGESQREAGRRLGLTHDAARKRFQRLLDQLRAFVRGQRRPGKRTRLTRDRKPRS